MAPKMIVSDVCGQKVGENFMVEKNSKGQYSYQFGYETSDDTSGGQYRHELRSPDGTVVGRYGYRDAKGIPVIINYVVDEGGYRILRPGDLIFLDAEQQPQDGDSSANRARLDLEEGVEVKAGPSLGFPAIPLGSQPIHENSDSFGYVLVHPDEDTN